MSFGRRLARAIAVASVGIVACVGDEPAPSSAPSSNDGGAGLDSAPAVVPDAAPDVVAVADGDGGSFCARHPGTALCEDFEAKTFPPGGWLTQHTGASTLDVAVGYESPRAFASYHDSTSTNVDALLYRDDVVVGASHAKIRFSARVRMMTFGDPAAFTTLLYMRLASTRFVSLVMTGSGKAEVLDDNGSSSAKIVIPSFALGLWHAFSIELVRGPSSTMTLTLDGVAGTPLPIAAVTDGAKRIAIGLQSSTGSGSRRIEIDDVLVELE